MLCSAEGTQGRATPQSGQGPLSATLSLPTQGFPAPSLDQGALGPFGLSGLHTRAACCNHQVCSLALPVAQPHSGPAG